MQIKIFITILLLAFSGSAFADIIRCEGEYTSWNKKKLPIQIDIVIPEKVSVGISLWSLENKHKPDRVLGSVIGEGLIEISKPQHHKKRHEFLITQMPRGGYSLVGFYLWSNHVFTLRADLWKPDIPFFFYDPWANELITGNCEK